MQLPEPSIVLEHQDVAGLELLRWIADLLEAATLPAGDPADELLPALSTWIRARTESSVTA